TLRLVTIANTAAPTRLVAKCMLVTTANGCGVPAIQSTRSERPATVNTAVAKNLSAASARARASATRASDSPNQQRVTVVPLNSSGTATVTKKMAKPTLVEERTAGRRLAAAIRKHPPARAIVTQGRPACWPLTPKSTISATHVAPALAMGNAMRNELGGNALASRKSKKGATAKRAKT